MLRTLFVAILLVGGWALALRGPLEGLYLYLWIAYFRPEQWVWTGFFASLPLSYTAGVYVVFRSILSGAAFRFDLRVALLVAMGVQSALSTYFSDYSAFCYLYFRDFAKSLIISYLIAVLATDVTRLRAILLVIGYSLGFEATKQGWVQLLLNPGGTNANPVPFLGDNNAVAVGMLMLVAMLVALGQTATRRWERWLHYFVAVGVLYRSISTYSRGGFLAAAALGLVFLVRSKRKGRALVAIAVVATITLSVLPREFWQRMDTITVEEQEERDESSAGRLHFWQVAIRMAKDNPFVGVGHAAYNQSYNKYDFSNGRFGPSRSVHSAWFGVLSELGYVGFAIFVCIIVLAFLSCRRASRLAKQGKVSSDLGFYATAIESSLIVFSVGGAFVIFQYTEMLWHVIAMSMAIHFVIERELANSPQAVINPVAAAKPVRPFPTAAALTQRR